MKDKPLVQAVCSNGHWQVWWASPFMVPQGSGHVNVWGGPLYCHCGAHVRASA